ncbi:hypothetical protein Q1695_003122 [Nippostrongylus brasiliensis]|nr:hypothetical protein Q1695_003122 [Nippostrongylus brasiliensis]
MVEENKPYYSRHIAQRSPFDSDGPKIRFTCWKLLRHSYENIENFSSAASIWQMDFIRSFHHEAYDTVRDNTPLI